MCLRWTLNKLEVHEKKITAASGILTSLGVLGGVVALWLTMIEIENSESTTKAEIVFQINNENAELSEKMRGNSDAKSYIESPMSDLNKFSPEIRSEAESYMLEWFNLFFSLYMQRRYNVVDDDLWQAYSESYCKFLRFPSVKRWWTSFGNKMSHHRDYMKFIESIESDNSACSEVWRMGP